MSSSYSYSQFLILASTTITIITKQLSDTFQETLTNFRFFFLLICIYKGFGFALCCTQNNSTVCWSVVQ